MRLQVVTTSFRSARHILNQDQRSCLETSEFLGEIRTTSSIVGLYWMTGFQSGRSFGKTEGL